MREIDKQFLDSVSEGKWFVVKGKHGGKYAVKMIKSRHYEEDIHSLWLSSDDPESMAIEDYSKKDWSFTSGFFNKTEQVFITLDHLKLKRIVFMKKMEYIL